MKIKFVYKILPVLVLYTDNLDPKWGGYCYGPFIKIRNKYKDDIGLLEHELTHSKQVYRTIFLHGLFYKFSETYRVKSEVEAYKVQASYYNNKSMVYEWMADAILEKYKVTKYSKKKVINMLNS